MTYPVGIDVSRHNGKMDWPKAYAACLAASGGVQPFAAIRCTVGDYYADPEFDTHWGGAKLAGFLTTAYHVVTPEISTAVQMAHFRHEFGARVPDLPVVLDVELSRGQTSKTITACVADCASNLRGFHFPRPFIYTNIGFWDTWVARRLAWADYPLWVANYTLGAKPALPADWKTWAVWQWSAGGNRQGPAYGGTSPDMDLNRWGEALPYPAGQTEDELTGTQFQTLIDKMDAMLAMLKELVECGEIVVTPGPEPEPEPEPEPTPTPEPVPTWQTLVVTAERANARYSKRSNGAGKPILLIYPSDNAPVAERVQYKAGRQLQAWPGVVTADGGAKCWMLAPAYRRDDNDLYVLAKDVKKA